MALIHVIDKQEDRVIGTLNSDSDEWSSGRIVRSINNVATLDFRVHDKLSLMESRNRVVIKSRDGLWEEYIIRHTEGSMETRNLLVEADGSYVDDLRKSQKIPPVTLEGATPTTALDFALASTGWQRGEVGWVNMVRTITTEDYMDPYDFIGLIARTFGLEMRFRLDIQGATFRGRFVDMPERLEGFRGREWTFERDLLGLQRFEDSDHIVTALIALGPEPGEDPDGTPKERLMLTVEDTDALERWGRDGNHLWGFYEPDSYDPEMTEGRLRSLAETELKKRINAYVRYEVDAIAHDDVMLGELVRVKDEAYDPPLYLEARVREIEEDPVTNDVLGFHLGDFIQYSRETLEADLAGLRELLAKKLGKDELIAQLNARPEGLNLMNQLIVPDDGSNRVQYGGNIGTPNEVGDLATVVTETERSFDRLHVGVLESPTVVSINTENRELFIDPENGNDGNDGLSTSTALQTVQAAIDAIPHYNAGTIDLRLVTGYSGSFYESLSFVGLAGPGVIRLHLGNATLVGEIEVNATTNYVEINNGTVKASAWRGLDVYRSPRVTCTLTKFIGGTGGRLAFAEDGGHIRLDNCDFQGGEIAIYARMFGEIFVNNCTGTGTAYGLGVNYGGVIRGYGTAPAGLSGNTTELRGGQIIGNFTFPDAPAPPPPPPPEKVTKTYTASSWGTYRASYNRWDTDNYTNTVAQGSYGYGVGNLRGAWFFGSQLNEVQGKAVKNVRVYIKRETAGGAGGAVRARLRIHGYTSRPGGIPNMDDRYIDVSLERGQGKWVKLPSSWYSAFESGAAKGIGVYSPYTTALYMRLEERARIEVTYE